MKIKGTEVPVVDIITGGSPCQDLSVAGKREGLAGERSGLFMEQMRIVKEMRSTSKQKLISEFGEDYDKTKVSPRYMVWENVCTIFDTLVETSNGLKKIGEIREGELVRTHDGTYHRVVLTHKTEMQPTLKIKYQGGELVCTPNHPILSEDMTYKPACAFTVGDRVGFKVDIPGTKSIGMPTAYAFGRWLADGSVAIRNDRKTKHRIFISTGYKKYEDLKAELSKLPYRINEHKMEWAVNFTFSSDEFGELTDSAGYGARYKQVPEWVFNLIAEEQAEVLRGYLSGDGYQRTRSENHTECSYTTASEKLAYGIARLVRAVYHIGVSLSYTKGKGTTIIEGREVNAHDSWYCSFSIPSKYEHNIHGIAGASKFENGYVWCKIREISEGDTQDVYNLSVEDNNTFIANGIVCHNCGAYSSGTPSGADFQAVLEEIARVVLNEVPSIPIPEEGWPYAGNLEGVAEDNTPFSICWRTHDAQYWGKTIIDDRGRVVKAGTPQRRRRIALVADFGGYTAPEILLECDSLPGNSEQSTKEGQAASDTVGTSFAESGPSSEVENRNNNTPTTIAIEGNGSRESHQGDGYKESDVMYTLNTIEQHAVCVEEPILLESNQNHATVQTDGVSTSLPASMGEGGGYVPMVVEGCDVYNHEVTGEVAATVTAACGGSNTSDPKVLMQGFDSYNQATTGEVAKPLTNKATDSDHIPVVYGFEPGAAQRLDPENRFNEEVAPTLRANMGDNQVAVAEATVYGIDQQGGKGTAAYSEDVAPTMASDSHGTPHAVCYGMCSLDSNSMKSPNPNSGIYRADTSRTLDLNGGNPACNQGGMMVVQESIGLTDSEKDQIEDWVNAVNSSAKHQQDLIQSDLGVAHTIAPGTHASGPHLTKTLVTSAVSETPIKESTKTYGVTAKGNGDAFIAEERHTALSTGGGEPGQGYPCILTEQTDPVGCLNPWEHQGKHIQSENGVAETLYAGEARYGGGESYVLQTNTYQDTTGALCAAGYSKLGTQEASNDMYVVETPVQCMEVFHCTTEDDKAHPLKARDYKDPQVIAINDTGHQNIDTNETAFTLGARDYRAPQAISVDQSHTLDTTPDKESVVYGFKPDQGAKAQGMGFEEEKAPTLSTCNNAGVLSPVVRRLTPKECERLQGFPDNWTLLDEWVDTKGKKHKDSDSARYKALGNSIALPFWYWMSGRMVNQLRKSGVEHPTMASLFDGICGFPLVYAQHGCTPVWASEIEEFPIAVAKKHFGDDDENLPGDYEQYINNLTPFYIQNQPSTCLGLDRASFNQGQNAKYDFSVEDNLAQTLVSRGPGGVMTQ